MAGPHRDARTDATSSKRSSAFHCGPTRHEIKPGAVAGAELVRRELVVHTTATEVTEDDAAHIQSVFAALVDDDRRTAQICADVHTAVDNGRTCLVLTQRTDHIDAIVTGLDVLGVHALVLKGGLGKKARAAVSDAIASRSPERRDRARRHRLLPRGRLRLA